MHVKAVQYYAANVFYYPIETISLGMELTTGTRKKFNDYKGHATRFSMLAMFNF